MPILLREHIVEPDLKLRLLNLENRIRQDYLRFWQIHAPHYTDHGENHCKAVEINLDELIPDEVKETMNEYEIFLLLSSVKLHDIGMMCAVKKDEKTEEVRLDHHQRSREFISKNLTDLLNFHERLIIGEISYAHADSVPIGTIDETKTIRHANLGDINIRVRFLASLLRFGDACDLCHTRTSEEYVDISKISEESAFYHNLHERVSGINFNQKNKSIELSINIKSQEEEKIVTEFIVDKLKKTLDTVRDIFIKNNVFYVDILPKYSIQEMLAPITVPSSIPQRKKPVSFEMELQKLESNARELYLRKDYKKSLNVFEKIVKDKPNDILSLNLTAQAYSQEGNNRKASEYFNKMIRLDPKDPLYWSNAGHFFGEIKLSMRKSYKCLKKAYELDSIPILNTLNYAEALITIGKYNKAYILSTKCWKEAKEIKWVRSAQILRIISLFLKPAREDALIEIRRLVNLYRGLPEIPEPTWVYSKIRKYIRDNISQKHDKEVLLALLDLTDKKISIDDFDKKFERAELL